MSPAAPDPQAPPPATPATAGPATPCRACGDPGAADGWCSPCWHLYGEFHLFLKDEIQTLEAADVPDVPEITHLRRVKAAVLADLLP